MPRLAVLALIALAATAACGPPDVRIERLDLQDLQAPAMFREVAGKLRAPYLLELPGRPINDRFDLALDDTTLGDALEAMARLDPQFQATRHGDVLAFWPSRPADLEVSPFSKQLPDLRFEAGAGEAVRRVLTEAGLADTTSLTMQTAGLRRPVTLDLKGASVRDALISVAAQAHLGFIAEPGSINALAVAE